MSTGIPHSRLATHEAAHWHALQREGAMGAEQQARFMDWLVASPAHLREYLAVSRAAAELGDALRSMPIDLEALVAADRERTAPDNVVALPVKHAHPARATPRPRRGLRAIAAAAAVVACLAVATHLAWPRTAHYVAAHGAPRSFALPDGTTVHLNAESELSIRFGPLHRHVEMSRGQASFVVADDRRPFEVAAAGLRVQDIGTTFGVWLQREQARIDVLEGRVRVVGSATAPQPLADLGAGQSARIDYRDHRVEIDHEDADAMTAWWQGRVVFRDEPLREIADRINRLSRVRLVIDDAGAGELRLTGSLRGGDVDALRAFLQTQPGLYTVVGAEEIRVASRPQ